jgi:2-succinyl-6-hydroxy-2,4-cyclohexadiene-1-carboxylate synthase
MLVDADSVKINIEKLRVNENARNSLFLLHGFTGSSSDWLNVCFLFDAGFNIYAIDLIGHGKSDSPQNVSCYAPGSQANQIKTVIEKFKGEKNILLGYSMGGRLAVTFAVTFPELIDGLILESSSAGIDNVKEQEKRTERDTKLAEMIMTKPIEEFISSWMDQELFGTLKRFSNSKLDEMKKEKSKSSRTGLANSLRGFSTGLMNFSASELKSLKFPVLLLSGQLDSKFTKINSNLQKQFSKAKHSVVKTSGHNTHLEEPKHFIQIVNKFLQRI